MIDQILYASMSARGDFDVDRDEILRVSRRNNPELGISGLLLIDRDLCMQLLEGDVDNLAALMDVIRTDTRHDRFVILEQRSVTGAAFPGWAMGIADAGAGTAAMTAQARAALRGVTALPGMLDRFVALGQQGRATAA